MPALRGSGLWTILDVYGALGTSELHLEHLISCSKSPMEANL